MQLTATSWLGWVMSKVGKSSPTTIAFTPGIADAADVSIDNTLAWAWGDRRNAPWSWPGRLRSAAKRALPMTLS